MPVDERFVCLSRTTVLFLLTMGEKSTIAVGFLRKRSSVSGSRVFPLAATTVESFIRSFSRAVEYDFTLFLFAPTLSRGRTLFTQPFPVPKKYDGLEDLFVWFFFRLQSCHDLFLLSPHPDTLIVKVSRSDGKTEAANAYSVE